MAKESGKKSFLDFFKMKDLDDDEFDDDLFDDEDDDDYDDYEKPSRASKSKLAFGRNSQAEKPQTTQPTYARNNYSSNNVNTTGQAANAYRPQSQQSGYGTPKQQARPAANNKLVDFNSTKQRADNYRGRSEVYVIKPQEISESQTVADFLKSGKTIVINMEGLELAPAQRIIDFIGGACYALNGSLQAISANIFIAAPDSIEVSGDLREEILNESTISPQLGQF